MSFWGLYACCMLFFGILQHYSSRICMCVCWIEKKCALSVYILYIFGKFFFTSAPRSSAVPLYLFLYN